MVQLVDQVGVEQGVDEVALPWTMIEPPGWPLRCRTASTVGHHRRVGPLGVGGAWSTTTLAMPFMRSANGPLVGQATPRRSSRR